MINLKDAIENVSQKEPLFSSAMYALKPVESDQYQTLGTDGEFLFYNQKFLDTLNEEEAAAVVLHEVMHCMHRHVWRREERDPMLWNIAADYAINIMVNESFALPKGALLDMKYWGMSAEEIYDSLPKQESQKQGWCEKHGWEGQESEGEGDSQDQKGKDKKDGKGSGKGKGKEKEDKDGKGGGKGLMDKLADMLAPKKPMPKSTMTEEQKDKKWKKIFEDTFIKNYGKLSDSMKRLVEKTFYMPVLDWASLVMNLLSEDYNDYSFHQPDRRFLDEEYVLPDLYSYDRLKDIVFAYDTSGSISDRDLKSFYMETLNLFNNFSSLQGWIAICDADLHHFDVVNPQQSFTDFKFYGGGGTDFRPVFDAVKEKGIKPKALFYFTDTYGSFPSEPPPYPVFWLVKSEIGDSDMRSVPFGEVVKFMPRT